MAGVFHSLRIAGCLRILQVGVGITGELGVDRQPDTAAVGTRHFDSVLHPLGAAGDGGHIGVVLLWGQNFFQNGSQLDLAQDAAGLDARQHLFQAAHIGGKALHLTQALVHLFQLGVDRLEALGHPLLQGILQLFVHRAADLVQLLGILCLQGGHAFGQRFAHFFQLAGVGSFQPLQALFHGLLLRGLPGIQGAAHALHSGLQRFADAAHGVVVLPGQLGLLLGKELRLGVQLLTHPLLEGFVVLPGCRFSGSVQQQCLLQADGHQQNRIQKRKKFHGMSPYKIQDPGRADAKPGPFAFYSVS